MSTHLVNILIYTPLTSTHPTISYHLLIQNVSTSLKGSFLVKFLAK